MPTLALLPPLQALGGASPSLDSPEYATVVAMMGELATPSKDTVGGSSGGSPMDASPVQQA